MGRIARATIMAAGSAVMIPWLAHAEPMVLTPTQMASVTAAAQVAINVPINIGVQTNVTTQVANAVGIAVATCGVCVGSGPTAASSATARNFNVSRQLRR